MKTIRKIAVIGIALAFVVVVAPVNADAGRYHRHHNHHNRALLPLAVAGAVVGTAAILSAGAVVPAYPGYYGPAPVVYGPAPYGYGPVWVPGHYNYYGAWVPGYYR